MAKKQMIVLTNKVTKRLHRIRDYLGKKNLNDTFIYLINHFNSGFEKYVKKQKK